jgi:hypothetical protein
MAYSKTPTMDTYSSQRLPAVYPMDMRVGVTPGTAATRLDAGLLNLVPRKVKDQKDSEPLTHAESRPPICGYQVASTTNPVRGCYVWQKDSTNTYYFVVVGTAVYSSTNGTSWAQVNTLLTNVATPVGFTEFIDDSNVKSLVLVDGVEGYVYTTNAAGTKIVDADFPTPHVPYPIFLDGFLFLAKAGTADIYNSDLNDPAAWTTGSFISSEMYPDDIVALAKVNNYLLAIGRSGSEFMYDAANPSGTPLARYEGGVLPFGSALPYTMASTKNMLAFIANNNDGEFVLRVVEDFKAQEIECPWLMSYLGNCLRAGTDPDNLRGYFLRSGGDLMYVLRIPSSTLATDAGYGTFVYSFETKQWTEFGYGTAGTAIFNVTCAAQGNTDNPLSFVAGNYYTGSIAFFGSFGISPIANASMTYGVDYFNGLTSPVSMGVEVRTTAVDFGTMNYKFLYRFAVNQTLSDSTATPSMTVAWSDGDYSFTNSVAMSVDYGFPFTHQLGAFRRRAFKVTGSGAYSYRIRGFELDINKGQN